VKNTLLAIAFFWPTLIHAYTIENDTLRVDQRQFYVGTVSLDRSAHSNYLYFQSSNTLQSIVMNDPIVSDWKLRFLESFIPASDLVSKKAPGGPFNRQLTTRVEERVEGYEVYEEANQVFISLYPKSTKNKFSVTCSRGIEALSLNLCSVLVRYPYGEKILLTANKFFPGPLQDIAHRFEGIADRLVQIATCLDITDASEEKQADVFEMVYTQETIPDNCQIPLTS
jgi:hypothetical protein